MIKTEAETRKRIIDQKIEDAGWEVLLKDSLKSPSKCCIEIKVEGMPICSRSPNGNGYIDYVLYGDDLKPLAIIEAKKTSEDEKTGISQAHLYADILEKKNGYRPITYMTNGNKILIEDGIYPIREVNNFHRKEELQWIYQKRKNKITNKVISQTIAGRPYQLEAVKEVVNYIDNNHSRALIVLATGTGKTRISCALCDLFLRNEYVKRILFLADRKNLVKQAKEGTFDKFLKNYSSALICDGVNEDEDGHARIVFSTYQSMMKVIEDKRKCPYGTGHFDLVIVDEAHRSLYNKFKTIFDYFDSILIGLTATPRDDIHKSTYKVFNLPDCQPNYAYEFWQGVKDGYLKSYRALDATPDIIKNGLKYNELSDEEKEEYEEKFTDDDGEIPDEISGQLFTNTIINEGTIKEVLNLLLDPVNGGLRTNNGDVLGKTIIFAKNHKHAEMIRKVFLENFQDLVKKNKDYCVVIDNQIPYNEELQRRFKTEQDIRIAISVDMLDTGFDVPDCVNLVFFKKVLSRIKFWQMIGRGTRLCPDLNVLSPSSDYFERRTDDNSRKVYKDKQGFLIFDICGVFSFFGENPDGKKETSSQDLSLNQRIFLAKVMLLKNLQKYFSSLKPEDKDIYFLLRKELWGMVLSLNRNLISVRNNLAYVEKFSDEKKWENISDDDFEEIKNKIVPIIQGEDELDIAKHYDLTCFELMNTKYGIKNNRTKNRFWLISKLLLNKTNIDIIREKEELIKETTDENFVNTSTISKINFVRKELRDLIKYIKEEFEREIITDFEDRIDKDLKDADGGNELVGENAVSNKVNVLKMKDYILSIQKEETYQKIWNLRKISDSEYYYEKGRLARLFGDDFVTNRLETKEGFVKYVRKVIGISKTAKQETVNKFEHWGKGKQELIKGIVDFVEKNGYITIDDVTNPDYSSFSAISALTDEEIDELLNFVNEIN